MNNYKCDTNHTPHEEEECNSDDYDGYNVFEEDEEATRIDIFNTDNSYSIIYADSSWEGYHSTEELLKLPVERVADENCALFIWVKTPIIPEAQKVIEEWGFKYEVMPFIWVKRTLDKERKTIADYDETSKWTRENTEVCLLATKGTLQRVNDNVTQVIACIIEEQQEPQTRINYALFNQE